MVVKINKLYIISNQVQITLCFAFFRSSTRISHGKCWDKCIFAALPKVKLNIAVLIGVAMLLIAWACIKWLKFGLGFYYSDVYVHDQLSRLWYWGEPLFHENRYGNNLALHNTLLAPLWSIFTIPFGVPGLFILHLLFIITGVVLYLKFGLHHRDRLWLLFGLFLGPYAYWLFDNRPYGWHQELLYFPLSWILALGLKYRQHKTIIMSALAIILLREDGVILFWAIATYFLITQKKSKLWSRDVMLLTLGCMAIFFLGMGLLSISGAENSRISEALMLIRLQPREAALNFLESFGKLLLFSLPFFLFYMIRSAFKSLLTLLTLSIPLIIAAWISGMHYFPDTYHGMLWQPRVAALWSIFVAGLMIEEGRSMGVLKISRQILYIGILWGMQFVLLILIRDHNLYTMITDIKREKEVYDQDRFYPEYQKLSQQIGVNKSVVIPYEYFHLFHRHIIIWPDHPENRLRDPAYVIARDMDSIWHYQYADGYDSIPLKSGLKLKWKPKANRLPGLSE